MELRLRISKECYQFFNRIENSITFAVNIVIDLLAILQKSLDRAIFLYNFIYEARLTAVRASIAIVHIRKFYKL